MRIGVISDTHDLLRPEAREFLTGCRRIIHAGDICGPGVIEALGAIAPVSAVRGNNDRGAWSLGLPATEVVRLDEVSIYVVHDIADLDIDPRAAGVRVVISGHSHTPQLRERDGVLYLNPGSAGPRRFSLPISVAELHVDGGNVRARLVELPTP